MLFIISKKGLFKLFIGFNWHLFLVCSRAGYRKDNLRSGSIFVSLCNNITFRWVRRNENRAWYKSSTNRLPPTLLIDGHLPNQPTKITSVVCFSSVQIFHACEKCRLADLKNSFYLLIFSAMNKTVSTITFNFLRD